MLSYLQSTYGISPLSVIAAENPQIAQIVNSNAPITTPNINTIYQYSNLIPGTTTINMPGSTINNVPIIIPTQQHSIYNRSYDFACKIIKTTNRKK